MARRPLDRLLAVGLGALLIAVLAQVSLPLPWTPVPITGQTFGVALVALLWGRVLGLATIVVYLGAAALGAPVLAGARAGLIAGPTLGYLAGMPLAAMLVGTLADRGWTRSMPRAWLAATCGSAIVFACGLLVLSRFVPSEALLSAGLWPFIPGDLLKNSLAATIASRTARLAK